MANNLSFIALAHDNHVFCLHAEAEGAILHATKRFKECAQNLTFMWEGSRRPCGYASAGRSYHKMWAVLNHRNNSVLSVVRIGKDCMNLVTVI